MRGKKAPKRKIKPDAKFNNLNIAKFINYIMDAGKKSTAEAIVYNAFDIISEKTKDDPVVIFDRAVKNITPSLEVKGKRVGGANYQVPMMVKGTRKFQLASRWIIAAAKARKGKPMQEKLAFELMDAAKGEGAAMKKKEDVRRMAEANRAFAHFARY
ncbi:30S ribosomal protein S7 [Candidatus Falkowbacteria bacterium]|jgi:small subunit ribosomal protein S7|nr:30S ribosomal protein S7 [Candidatus Falkowbacteria bacterium]MBT4432990.1 30S ribosomal protein S7 [Candidatus Falkowbacteria bacterium]